VDSEIITKHSREKERAKWTTLNLGMWEDMTGNEIRAYMYLSLYSDYNSGVVRRWVTISKLAKDMGVHHETAIALLAGLERKKYLTMTRPHTRVKPKIVLTHPADSRMKGTPLPENPTPPRNKSNRTKSPKVTSRVTPKSDIEVTPKSATGVTPKSVTLKELEPKELEPKEETLSPDGEGDFSDSITAMKGATKTEREIEVPSPRRRKPDYPRRTRFREEVQRVWLNINPDEPPRAWSAADERQLGLFLQKCQFSTKRST